MLLETDGSAQPLRLGGVSGTGRTKKGEQLTAKSKNQDHETPTRAPRPRLGNETDRQGTEGEVWSPRTASPGGAR